MSSKSSSLGHGITCVDTGLARPHMAACYLIESNGRLAIVETGIKQTVDTLIDLIEAKGYQLSDVDWVIITHVHLDHAGGAGRLMSKLPNAKLVVHPRGARHMIDPSKLQAGAKVVYGEEKYNETYGDLIPIAEDKIHIAEDGSKVKLGTREFIFIDSPGHAKHHFCVYDTESQGFFTGDTLGLRYAELTTPDKHFCLISTTPVQFDPDAMKESIHRVIDFNPAALYLTHYGKVENLIDHQIQLFRQIDWVCDMALSVKNKENRQQLIETEMMNYALAELEKIGSPLTVDEQRAVLAPDIRLNAQGIDVWLSQVA
ncbi:MBL fold metallo-hydrolase [Aurantivibrio plasticivorans]